MFPDIVSLEEALNAASEDSRVLAADLTEEEGIRRPAPESWSIAECMDHLAVTNRVYLAAMQSAAARARSKGRLRRGPATPGWFGSWFARQLEPPLKPGRKMPAPQKSRPRQNPSLADAYASFLAEQQRVHGFLQANADLDLTGVRFANPFVPGLRFSLASGLNIILAHERRHLWQAQQILIAANQKG